MTLEEAERRAEPRIPLVRPCKAYDPRSRRYVSGTTWNVSRRGVLFELDRPVPLRSGDHLYIGVAYRRREGVLCRGEMLPGRVTRALMTADDRTVVAIELDEPIAILSDPTGDQRVAA
jgi:hypothetical protein